VGDDAAGAFASRSFQPSVLADLVARIAATRRGKVDEE
jgi:DNA repair protein RadA/Sms